MSEERRCSNGHRWFGYPVCPDCIRRAQEKIEYDQRYQAEIQKAAQKVAEEKQEQKPVETYRSDLLEQIGNLRMRIEQLEKTVEGLKSIEKTRWQNLISRLKDE